MLLVLVGLAYLAYSSLTKKPIQSGTASGTARSSVQSSSVATGSKQAQPVPTTPSGHTNTGPSSERNYNEGVQSELAARLYSAQFGVRIGQARYDIQLPENQAYKINAMGMARAGQLDYLLNGGWVE